MSQGKYSDIRDDYSITMTNDSRKCFEYVFNTTRNSLEHDSFRCGDSCQCFLKLKRLYHLETQIPTCQ